MTMNLNQFLEQNPVRENFIDIKNSSWDEITAYCEKDEKMWRVSGNGMHYLVKKFWCGHYSDGPNGERPCSICKGYRDWGRERDVRDKIGYAFKSSSTLYITNTMDKAETNRLIYRLQKRGGRYLSIPSNEDGGKLFLLDLYDKLSDPVATTQEEALDRFLPFKDKTQWGNFSGNFGKETDGDEQDSDDTVTYTMPTKLNVYIPKELMHGVETEAILRVSFDELTIDNVEEALNEKLSLVENILNECGVKNAKHVGEQEVSISLRKLKDTWFAAKVSVISHNDLRAFPTGISAELENTARNGLVQLMKSNRSYLAEHEEAVE